ncbi:hypothetical protein EIP91_010715, partial [Steccherinum ochraceum]
SARHGRGSHSCAATLLVFVCHSHPRAECGIASYCSGQVPRPGALPQYGFEKDREGAEDPGL